MLWGGSIGDDGQGAEWNSRPSCESLDAKTGSLDRFRQVLMGLILVGLDDAHDARHEGDGVKGMIERVLTSFAL